MTGPTDDLSPTMYAVYRNASERIGELDRRHPAAENDPPCDCVVKGTHIRFCAYHRDLGLMAIARIRLEHPWIATGPRPR